jgi:hypothetical protein
MCLAAPAHALIIYTDQASFNAGLPGPVVPVVEGFEGKEQPFDPLIPGGFQFDGFTIFPQGGTSESAVVSGTSPLNPDADGSFLNLVIETERDPVTGQPTAFESHIIDFAAAPVTAFSFTYRASASPDPFPFVVQTVFTDFNSDNASVDIPSTNSNAFLGVVTEKPILFASFLTLASDQTSELQFGIDDFGTFTQAASAVPEPATAGLLGLGLAGLALRARRRRGAPA